MQRKKVDVAPTSGGNGNVTMVTDKKNAVEERGAWGSQMEFILTCIGTAVGLGNVWRFPYLAYANGGGAFLIPYFIMLALCGIPVFYFELAFGQFASLGPIAIWSSSPAFKGLGMAMLIITLIVALSYHVLIAYIIYYFFASMTSVLPWSDCENSWNTDFCVTTDEVKNNTYIEWYLKENNLTRTELRTPSEEYYYKQVLQLSPSIDEPGYLVWELALCLLLSWIVVFLVLIKGIKSLGKVVYFMSTFPYVMMTVMVVRGLTLEGAWTGVEYYLVPEWGKLLDAKVWSDAASQIFYSLSTCSGGLIAMASYNKFHNNVYRDSIMVPLINCATSVYAGFAIFAVLGFMAELKGVGIDEVAASGPGLVFVVYPEGLSQMPAAPVWSVLFFFMMLTLGFSSSFSMVETMFVAVQDEFPDVLRSNPTRQILFRGVSCFVFFLLGLPMVTQGGFYLFNVVDYYAGAFPRLFIGVLELVAITWFYGLARFCEDIVLMIGKKPNFYFRYTWVAISPIIVLLLVITQSFNHALLSFNGVTYPPWTDSLGWCIAASIMVPIPAYAFYQWMVDGGIQALKKSVTPLDSWGPAELVNRTGHYAPSWARAPEVTQPTDPPQVVVKQFDNAAFVKVDY